MITINATFSQRERNLGLIGRRGENGTRQIAFDCSEVLAEYPYIWGESMKKNILIKTGERMETRIRTIPAQYNEMGEMIADGYDETYTVTVPVMEPRNVEMTPEEVAEMEAMQAAMPEPQPTLEDCQAVADMAYVNSELALSMLNEMEV